MKREKTCSVCGRSYKYCPNCREDKDKPTWYFTFCSPNCKNIYNATSSFEFGKISADEAKKALDKLDLSKIVKGTSYAFSIKKINDAISSTKVEISTEKKEEKATPKKTVAAKNLEKAKETKANSVE